MNMVEFKNVSKRFGSTVVLEDVNFSIKQGEVGDDASDFMLGEGVTSAEVNTALAAFVAAALEGEGGKA